MPTITPQNILQNVALYQKAELAWLLNNFVMINKSNKKFKNFNNNSENLGSTVTFDKQPRAVVNAGLEAIETPQNQRVQNLICAQAMNWCGAYTDEQFMFNAKDYLDRFGKAAIIELGSQIEADILRNAISGMVVNDPNNRSGTNGLALPVGTPITDSGPYRFYGDGITPINSVGQLAQALANFEDFGMANDEVCGLLPLSVVPAIVNTALSQFVPDRNEMLATKWQLGEFGGCMWYKSNLLPKQIAGTVGNTTPFGTGNLLTLISTNDSTGANITQLTFSGAQNNDPNAIKSGDLGVFKDGVADRPNERFLTFNGHIPCDQPVQFMATANAASNGSSQVTININPPLCSQPGNSSQNISSPLQVGMQVLIMPSHRAGLIWSGRQNYLAMPRLPDMSPYETSIEVDPDSGASIRHYWGAGLGNTISKKYIRDVVYGATWVPDNFMRLLFPL